MNELEKIKIYIDRTPPAKISAKSKHAYGIRSMEIIALTHESPCNAVCWAFEYGRAKGLRMGRNEASQSTEQAITEPCRV